MGENISISATEYYTDILHILFWQISEIRLWFREKKILT